MLPCSRQTRQSHRQQVKVAHLLAGNVVVVRNAKTHRGGQEPTLVRGAFWPLGWLEKVNRFQFDAHMVLTRARAM